MQSISVIIVAAGESKRLKSKIRKPYLILDGKPILLHSIELFAQIPAVREIVIAIHKDDTEKARRVISRLPLNVGAYCHTPAIRIVIGGATRAESVFNALNATSGETEIVLVHDAARPFVRCSDVINLIKEIRKTGAAILAIPVKDTIKKAKTTAHRILIQETITPRESLWAAQTPQGFKRDLLLKAYKQLSKSALSVTDDASLCERINVPVSIVPGSEENIKITTRTDLK